MSGPCQRVNSDGRHSPRTNIPFNWDTGGTVFKPLANGSNPFSIVTSDPNTNAFGRKAATGISQMDGTVTIALTAGFTPPVTLTAWEWNPAATDANGNAVGAWFKIGASAAQYNEVFDATYASYTFKIGEATPFLIQSSAAVTGQALMDAVHERQPGAQLEG